MEVLRDNFLVFGNFYDAWLTNLVNNSSGEPSKARRAKQAGKFDLEIDVRDLINQKWKKQVGEDREEESQPWALGLQRI